MGRYWFYMKNHSQFSSNLHVLRPFEEKKRFFVDMSVYGHDNFRQNYRIRLSFGTLFYSIKLKIELVDQRFWFYPSKTLLKKLKNVNEQNYFSNGHFLIRQIKSISNNAGTLN